MKQKLCELFLQRIEMIHRYNFTQTCWIVLDMDLQQVKIMFRVRWLENSAK